MQYNYLKQNLIKSSVFVFKEDSHILFIFMIYEHWSQY